MAKHRQVTSGGFDLTGDRFCESTSMLISLHGPPFINITLSCSSPLGRSQDPVALASPFFQAHLFSPTQPRSSATNTFFLPTSTIAPFLLFTSVLNHLLTAQIMSSSPGPSTRDPPPGKGSPAADFDDVDAPSDSNSESSEYEGQHPLTFGVVLERNTTQAPTEEHRQENASTASPKYREAIALMTVSHPPHHQTEGAPVTTTPSRDPNRSHLLSSPGGFDPDTSWFVVASNKKSWAEFVELASPDASHSD